MLSAEMGDSGQANTFPNRRIFPANNGYGRENADMLNTMPQGSANMCLAPRWEIFERRIFSLIGEYFPQSTRAKADMLNPMHPESAKMSVVPR